MAASGRSPRCGAASGVSSPQLLSGARGGGAGVSGEDPLCWERLRVSLGPLAPEGCAAAPAGVPVGRGRCGGRGRRRRRPGGAPVVPRTSCPGACGGGWRGPPVLRKRFSNGGGRGGGFGRPPRLIPARAEPPGPARAFVRSFRGR